MRCLNVFRVIISPSSAHSFRIPVVRNHIAIVCEFFVADRTLPVLLDNLAVQELSHLSRRSEFPISPRMMRIINSSNPRPQSARIDCLFTAAAGNRFVNRAVLIVTKPHGISSWQNRRNQWLVCGGRDGESLRWAATMPVRGGTMTNLTGVIRKLRKEKQRVHGEMRG